MILDTSALIAIFQNEPERDRFLDAIESAETVKISSATLLETSIVMMARYGKEGVNRLHEFLILIGAEEIPFSSGHRKNAEAAFLVYGKGSGHEAQLNLGDCFSYGLAKATNEPLLFKGNDFKHTDIKKDDRST